MKPELLSPAGGREALAAALAGGADAVYLGGPRFSARAYAANFTDQDLAESIAQCHRLGVKLYITINTLLKDPEIPEAYDYAVKVWNMGADAIIIQDPGLIALLARFHPELELHASTQMTIHNLAGADLMKAKGLTRLVLARELTLAEIRTISEHHETEVFIHGALCISYSGKCLMSSMLGGRSGNRGRCAQNCRMEYQLLDEAGSVRAEGYLMSPRDLSTLEIISQVASTGTASLKIEGRMKRPEYVYETVHQYKAALEGRPYDHAGITQLFNREGFNQAFLLGNTGADMMAFHSPRNSGVALGRVRQGMVRLQTALGLGDGIQAGESGFIVTKLKVAGREVSSAKSGDTVQIFPRAYAEGEVLVKTNDAALIRDINAALRQKRLGELPLTLKAEFHPGKPLRLSAHFQGQQREVFGDLVEEVQTKPLEAARLRENLVKTGGTPFVVEELTLDYTPGFIRLASVNDTRRRLLQIVEAEILLAREPLTPVSRGELMAVRDEVPLGDTRLPEYLITMVSKAQLAAFRRIAPDPALAVPVLYLWHRQAGSLNLADARALDEAGMTYWLRLPEILKSELDAVLAPLAGLTRLGGILTDNYGVIESLKDSGIPVVGDYKLNLLNSWAPRLYDELAGYTVSEELNYAEMIELTAKDRAYSILYGRTELMHSEYCPIGATVGGRTRTTPCSVPCQTMDFTLKDRKGEAFPILTDVFCRSYIMNSKIKNNLDQQSLLRDQGFCHFRADLSTEDQAEADRVIRSLLSGQGLYVPEHTRGHYKRGVE